MTAARRRQLSTLKVSCHLLQRLRLGHRLFSEVLGLEHVFWQLLQRPNILFRFVHLSGLGDQVLPRFHLDLFVARWAERQGSNLAAVWFERLSLGLAVFLLAFLEPLL